MNITCMYTGIKAKGMWNGVQVGGTGKIGDVYLVICGTELFSVLQM